MTAIDGAPYLAWFEGGPLDGRMIQVPSMAPDRFATSKGEVPARRPVAGVVAVYELATQSPLVYRHNPRRGPRT